MKTMSEQFIELAMFNREEGFFPSQLKTNPKGRSSSFFDPNDVWKINAVIPLRLADRVISIRWHGDKSKLIQQRLGLATRL